MTKENYFSKKLVGKSDAELRAYIENKEQYQEAAVLAAIWELEKRGILSEKAELVTNEIQERNSHDRR